MKIYFVCIIVSVLASSANTTTGGVSWTKILKRVGNVASSHAEAIDSLETTIPALFRVAGDGVHSSSTTKTSRENTRNKILKIDGNETTNAKEAKDNLRPTLSGLLSSLDPFSAFFTSSSANAINMTSTGDNAIEKVQSTVSGILRKLDAGSGDVSTYLRSVVNATSNGEEAIKNLRSTVSGLLSDLQERDAVSTSFIGNPMAFLNSVTKTVQNAVLLIASITVNGVLGTVRYLVNSLIGIASNMIDKVAETIAIAAGLDLDKGLLGCVHSAIKEGILTLQNLIDDVIDCPIDRIKSLTHKVTEIIGTPASAIKLANAAALDLNICKENHSSIFPRGVCILKTAVTVKWNALVLIAETVVRIFTTIVEVNTLGETLSICLTTTLAPLSLNVGKLIGNIGSCSVSSGVI